MIRNLKESFLRNLSNIPGWRSNRKLIVFQSDDWGSIRMPSKVAYRKLLERGIRVDQSIYNRYDILENREDLNCLFETLLKFRDLKGRHPGFNFNTVMGNPDFEKIKECNFEAYHFEHMFDSYKKYNNDDLRELWREAIEKNLIEPQYHAREHLNVPLWMKALLMNYHETRLAFENKFFGLKTDTPSKNQNYYLAAYWVENQNDYKDLVNITKDGLRQFKETFGYSSYTFVACNYIYPRELEKELFDLGVKVLHVQRGQLSPDIHSGKNIIKRHYTGQKNKFGQTYIVRNCNFEPSSEKRAVEKCMKGIESAFRWKKPAVISTHRMNYVGGLLSGNRDNGIRSLERLLKLILKQWPDAEFVSTNELGLMIKTGQFSGKDDKC